MTRLNPPQSLSKPPFKGSTLKKYRLFATAVISLLVALGVGSKSYSGIGQAWIEGYSGDAFYQMFWIWLVGSIKPQWRAERIAIATFLVSAAIEFSQLIPFPEAWQAQLWWRFVLGTTFSPPDFIWYAIGSLLGAATLIPAQRYFKVR
jgi:hypothetical protein